MFQIDLMSRTPVYEQIIEQLENFVVKGIISAGSQIPSVRSLSIQLSINPNTIQKAYTELDRKGIIYSVPGKGCFISVNAKDILLSLKRKEIDNFKQLAKELMIAGITKDELLKCIDGVYEDEI